VATMIHIHQVIHDARARGGEKLARLATGSLRAGTRRVHILPTVRTRP
jgi:hypothetical protein